MEIGLTTDSDKYFREQRNTEGERMRLVPQTEILEGPQPFGGVRRQVVECRASSV